MQEIWGYCRTLLKGFFPCWQTRLIVWVCLINSAMLESGISDGMRALLARLLPVCGCVFLSLSLSLSSNMLTAHSAGLISLLIPCESRLINTHLWQISTASCDRHSASSHYLIISAWWTHSKQCFLPVCLSLSVSDLLWHSQILTHIQTHHNTHTSCRVHKDMMLFGQTDHWDCSGD